MDRKSDEQIIKEIEDIEEKLKGLRLALSARERATTVRSQQVGSTRHQVNAKGEAQRIREENELRVGDTARITNPRVGQESVGTVIKVNRITDRVTIKGKLFRQKIVRATKNVERINKTS